MKMESWKVHYRNKFPGGRVQASENSLDVFDKNGEHVVALRKNGAGQWQDESEKEGLRERHDLAPIPRGSRVHKMVDGKIGRDDKSAEREQSRSKFLCNEGCKVLSMKELESKGFEFDSKGDAKKEPKAEQAG
jgi:hypothetical protein